MYNQIIGKKGEDIAIDFLKKKGYKIMERNFLCFYGEIDIIALDKKENVFIEVKTRTNFKYGKPIEAVNKVKQKHMVEAIKYYIYKNNLQNKFIRIDIIEIFIKDNKHTINHIKQAI